MNEIWMMMIIEFDEKHFLVTLRAPFGLHKLLSCHGVITHPRCPVKIHLKSSISFMLCSPSGLVGVGAVRANSCHFTL